MEKAIVVNRLSKEFEVTQTAQGITAGIRSLFSPQKSKVKAVKNISFSIEQGELVGFIGPNGAGKTTTLKVLSGLLYPTSGFTQVLGFDPWDRKPEFLKQISLVMGQKNQLWWDLSAINSFKLNKAIYEISDKKYKEVLDELSELLEVKDILHTQVRKLSLGQRMRMELIASLLHHPKVLFLDEPTIGLDVIAQQRIRDFIYDYNRRFGSTVILTSHNMDDLYELTKRVIVINKGEILFDGKFRELISRYARYKRIKISLSKHSDMKKLESIGKIELLDFPQVILNVPREAAAVAAAEILQNFPVGDLTMEEESIESIIVKVFRGETQ